MLWKDYVHTLWGTQNNAYVRDEINSVEGHQEPLLSAEKRRHLGWFGHLTSYDNLSMVILLGRVES